MMLQALAQAVMMSLLDPTFSLSSLSSILQPHTEGTHLRKETNFVLPGFIAVGDPLDP